MSDWLIDEIIRYTHSNHSVNFYKRAISLLGEGIVGQELGELKYQIQTGEVKNPAKYFTTLLKKQMKTRKSSKPVPGKILVPYKSPNQMQLFAELKLTNKIEADKKETSLDIIYREDVIKFPTLLSNTFFTLSTNKSKSDEVPIKLATHDGVINGTLVRGRWERGLEESRILTTFEGRIFLAVIHIWQEKGCNISKDRGDHLCGIVRFNISELTRKIYSNLKYGGRSDKRKLLNSITHLCDATFCIYCSEGNTEIHHGFSLLGMPSLTGIKRGRQTEKTGITVMLSPEITSQYFNKRYLNRPEQLIKVKNEIALLLWLYLESRVESLDGLEYSAELRYLIKELRLPEAKWHKRPSVRKQFFTEAIKEFQGQKTGSGRTWEVRINKGLFDYLLFAKLTAAKPPEIENKKVLDKI